MYITDFGASDSEYFKVELTIGPEGLEGKKQVIASNQKLGTHFGF